MLALGSRPPDVWQLGEVLMRIRRIVTSVLVFSLLWSSSALAQQRHVVDLTALRQAIATRQRPTSIIATPWSASYSGRTFANWLAAWG
jgi:hypothetical protein